MTTQPTPEQPQRKCGMIHQGQFCTRPATRKIPAGPNDAYAYVCDFHAGLIIGFLIEEQEKQQQ